MAITYPLNLPSYPAPKSMRFFQRQISSATASPFTGTQQIVNHFGQWWEIDFSLPPMERENAAPWIAFLMKLNGMQGTFKLGDYAYLTPLGSAAGNPIVDGDNQTGNTLQTAGWDNDTNNVLKAGDWIEIDNRLYRLLDDAHSDSTGNASLLIWPFIRQPAPASGTTILTENAKGLFRLPSPEVSWDIDTAKIYGLSFSAREAL